MYRLNRNSLDSCMVATWPDRSLCLWRLVVGRPDVAVFQVRTLPSEDLPHGVFQCRFDIDCDSSHFRTRHVSKCEAVANEITWFIRTLGLSEIDGVVTWRASQVPGSPPISDEMSWFNPSTSREMSFLLSERPNEGQFCLGDDEIEFCALLGRPPPFLLPESELLEWFSVRYPEGVQ